MSDADRLYVVFRCDLFTQCLREALRSVGDFIGLRLVNVSSASGGPDKPVIRLAARLSTSHVVFLPTPRLFFRTRLPDMMVYAGNRTFQRICNWQRRCSSLTREVPA